MELTQNCKKWFELKTRLGKYCKIDKFNSDWRPNICGTHAAMEPGLALVLDKKDFLFSRTFLIQCCATDARNLSTLSGVVRLTSEWALLWEPCPSPPHYVCSSGAHACADRKCPVFLDDKAIQEFAIAIRGVVKRSWAIVVFGLCRHLLQFPEHLNYRKPTSRRYEPFVSVY
jgi:hypothetical protein